MESCIFYFYNQIDLEMHILLIVKIHRFWGKEEQDVLHILVLPIVSNTVFFFFPPNLVLLGSVRLSCSFVLKYCLYMKVFFLD